MLTIVIGSVIGLSIFLFAGTQLGWFPRLAMLGKAKANAALDKLEDPIEMAKQGIKELDKKKQTAVQAQAKLKSRIIILKDEQVQLAKKADEWNSKATKLDKMIVAGSLDKDQGEKDIITCLNREEQLRDESQRKQVLVDKNEKSYEKLSDQIREIINMVEETKQSIEQMESRAETAEAMKDINKELSDIGGLDNVKSMIDRANRKITEDESLADAYAEVDGENVSDENRINQLLDEPSKTSDDDLLAKFRAKKESAE